GFSVLPMCRSRRVPSAASSPRRRPRRWRQGGAARSFGKSGLPQSVDHDLENLRPEPAQIRSLERGAARVRLDLHVCRQHLPLPLDPSGQGTSSSIEAWRPSPLRVVGGQSISASPAPETDATRAQLWPLLSVHDTCTRLLLTDGAIPNSFAGRHGLEPWTR